MKIALIVIGCFLVGMGIGVAIGGSPVDCSAPDTAADIDYLEAQLVEANRYAADWQGVAGHYKFYLDKMTHDNKQAKTDIERLLKACEELQAERDIYYKALHECLNPTEQIN